MGLSTQWWTALRPLAPLHTDGPLCGLFPVFRILPEFSAFNQDKLINNCQFITSYCVWRPYKNELMLMHIPVKLTHSYTKPFVYNRDVVLVSHYLMSSHHHFHKKTWIIFLWQARKSGKTNPLFKLSHFVVMI